MLFLIPEYLWHSFAAPLCNGVVVIPTSSCDAQFNLVHSNERNLML